MNVLIWETIKVLGHDVNSNPIQIGFRDKTMSKKISS